MSDYPGLEIVHRPGSEIPGVDFLSRHPVGEDDSDIESYFEERLIGVITDVNQVPTHKDYKSHQANDPKISSIIQRLENGTLHSKQFFIRNELLYRLQNARLVLELPEILIDNILYIHHDIPLSGHSAYERTYERIRNRFYFENMRQRIHQYCQSCPDCQTNKRPHGFKYGLMQMPKTSQICEKWFIDTCGPFPVSNDGNRDIIIAMESYSRFVIAEASPDTTAYSIQKFRNRLITTFGCFNFLISDNANRSIQRT